MSYPRTERKRPVGMSLAEVMVFCLLLGMLMGGLYLLLVGGLRNVRHSQAYQTAQQQALIAVRKLVGELSNARSDPATLLYQSTPPALVFLSAYPPYPAVQDHMTYDANGNVSWRKWVGYYLSGTNLMRAENTSISSLPMNFGLTGNPGSGTVVTLPAIPPGGAGWNDPPVAQRVVARNISLLDFRPGPSVKPLALGVVIYAQDATASDKFTQVQYQVNAWLSN